MADILKTLLQAYLDDFQTETSAGGTLSYIKHYFVIQSPLLVPPDWSTPCPFVLIYPQPITLTPDVIGMESNEKLYNITMSVFQEYPDITVGLMGDDYLDGVIDIADDL